MAGAGRILAFVAAVLGAFAIAWLSLQTPPERSRSEGDFQLTRAMAHIRVIAKEPHVTGSKANAAVRAYLVSELTKLGATVEERPFPLDAAAQKRMKERWKTPATEGVNVVGILPGSNRALSPIVVMAHYDSVPNSPGAADDASGVASALEIARVMQGRNRHDLIVLLTDAEEPALGGAKAFFAGDDRVGAVVNLESRGGAGRAALFETGKGQPSLVRHFAGEVGNISAHSFAMLVYRFLPNDTDFSPARDRGLPGFNFAFIGNPALYHSPASTPDAIDPGSVRHLGYAGLDTVRALDKLDGFKSGGEYPVFSDVFGRFVVSYAPRFGWIPIVVAALALAVTVAFAVRREDWRWRELAAGLGVGLLIISVAAAALWGMNIVSGAGAQADYYDRLAQTGWLEIQAGLLCGAILLAIPRQWMGEWGGFVALMVLGLVLGIAVQVAAPQAGPLVAWPVLVVTLASLPLVVSNSIAWRLPAYIALVVALGFVLYWAHWLFLGAGQAFPSTMAPFAFLAALALWPLLSRLPARREMAVAALILLLASTGVAMKIWIDPVAPTAPIYG